MVFAVYKHHPWDNFSVVLPSVGLLPQGYPQAQGKDMSAHLFPPFLVYAFLLWDFIPRPHALGAISIQKDGLKYVLFHGFLVVGNIYHICVSNRAFTQQRTL
jgi:hypothetical protein